MVVIKTILFVSSTLMDMVSLEITEAWFDFVQKYELWLQRQKDPLKN